MPTLSRSQATPPWHLAWVALVALASPMDAVACRICVDPSRSSLVQSLELRSDAVLARRDEAGMGYVVVDTIVGKMRSGTRIVEPSLRSAPVPVRDSTAALLVRDAATARWRHVAVVERDLTERLRVFADMKPTRDMELEDWTARTRYFVDLLADEDPLLAETAYLEIARAPYAAIRELGPHIPAAQLAAWLAHPDRYREPLYPLLLGAAGGEQAAANLEALRRTAFATRDAEPLAAAATALLEIHGEPWLEQLFTDYLSKDSPASLPEIQAVITALSVQGGAGGNIRKPAVLDLYERFIEARPALAGFVTPDLIDWERWEFTARLQATLETDGPVHPASRFLIIRYMAQAADHARSASAPTEPRP